MGEGGAAQRDVRRFAVLKRVGQRPNALFEVFSNDMHAPLTATQQPFLDAHVIAQLPDDAVTAIDLTTEADWSDLQSLDSLHSVAAIVHSLPLGAHDDPVDIYGNWMLHSLDAWESGSGSPPGGPDGHSKPPPRRGSLGGPRPHTAPAAVPAAVLDIISRAGSKTLAKEGV